MADEQVSEQNTITDAGAETSNTAAATAEVVKQENTNDTASQADNGGEQEKGKTLLGTGDLDNAEDSGQESAESEELELKAAEGSMVNENDIGSVSEFAQQHGLSKEQAQATLDLIANTKSTQVEEIQSQQSEAYQQQVEDWKQEISNDPVIGGERLQETDRKVSEVVLKYWGEDFYKQIQADGIGAHPGFIRGLVKLADSLKPDTLHEGELTNAGADTEQARLNRLFPLDKIKGSRA